MTQDMCVPALEEQDSWMMLRLVTVSVYELIAQ